MRSVPNEVIYIYIFLIGFIKERGAKMSTPTLGDFIGLLNIFNG